MPGGARRLLLRACLGCARRASLTLCIWPALPALVAAGDATITGARYVRPTDHYDHGVLGDAIEYSGMMVALSDGGRFPVGFSPGGRVFEDVAPRLWDVTGDGAPEIVVVETDPAQGAQLAIYGLRGGAVVRIAATPHIGRPHRWLAPVGAADLDGDGRIEIAYVDRPHLARVLRVWRYAQGGLHHVADLEGLTNHRIGWSIIAGGIRRCDGPPEMILANAGWRGVSAVRLAGGRLRAKTIAAGADDADFARAMACAGRPPAE